ncbi:MAG: hypothetical protein IJP68_05800 [Selenomonadaceae bacterium]|nr:hypothetical protein [Selenomonadaceae bacterium]
MSKAEERICAVCGSKFIAYGNQKYCNWKCGYEEQKRRAHERRLDRVAVDLHIKKAKKKASTPREELPLPVCRNCGKEFKTYDERQIFCCRACYNDYNRSKKKPAAKKNAGKTLGDWVREATECHLDYGTYRALIGAGKTYEELKEQAPSRQIRVHQHTPHREL